MPTHARDKDDLEGALKTLLGAKWTKLIMAAITLIGLAVGYLGLDGDIANTTARQDLQSQRMAEIETTVTNLKSDVDSLQGDVQLIQTGIDAALDELEKARKLIHDLQDIRDELVQAIQAANSG